MSVVWNILARLLGVRGVDVDSVAGARFALRGGPIFVVVLLGVLVVGVAIGVLTYVRTTEPIAVRKRVGFLVARILVYVFLAAALSGLVLSTQLETRLKLRCLVVVDDSASMRVHGRPAADRSVAGAGLAIDSVPRIERARALLAGGFLSDLRRTRVVRVQGLAGLPLGQPELAGLEASVDRTDLPGTLAGILRDRGAEGLAEIVLITDGRNTVRRNYKTASAALRERDVTLYPVLTGDAAGFRDVRLTSAHTTPYCRAFDRIVVTFQVRNEGCGGQRTRVEVVDRAEPDRILANAELVLAEDGRAQRGQLIFDPPGESGDIRLAVRVGRAPGETVIENNEVELFTRIVNEPIKVLVVDTFPRAEFKHVKWSLDRDPNLAVTFLNRMPGGAWLVQGPCLLEKPGLGFPSEAGELLKYDVLVLGTISRGYFSAGDRFEERKLTNIARFVSARGGGLIVLGGHRSFGHGKYRESPLDPLLPFDVLTFGEEPYLAEDFQAELTRLGRFHPIVQLADTVEENDRLWAELPELMGCNIVGKPRPGAQVLAVGGKPVAGEKPIILACQQYGAGRVFACTTYGTFRWRLGLAVAGGDRLSRFWSQAVRFVAPDPRLLPGTINIQVEQSRHVRGETARMVLRPLDAYYGAVRNAKIRMSVEGPDRRVVEMLLREDPSMRGAYPAEVPLVQAGTYQITAESEKGLRSQTALAVGVSSREFADIASAGDELAAAAAASGGRLFTIDEARGLPEAIPSEPRIVVRDLEVPLWDSPLLLFVILGMCVGEWFFRKRSGLA